MIKSEFEQNQLPLNPFLQMLRAPSGLLELNDKSLSQIQEIMERNEKLKPYSTKSEVVIDYFTNLIQTGKQSVKQPEGK